MERYDSYRITIFVCANSACQGGVLTDGGAACPEIPDSGLPGRVRQIVLPCAGDLQPERILKTFEDGSDVIVVIACEEDNCHYSEGSRRCALRVEYIRSLIEEIGLGEGRLLFFRLPGSAVVPLEDSIRAIRDQVLEALRIYPPNPLRMYETGAGER